ncbi:MAG TPA: SigE family RNA polymerase sigma factor [Actinocrinis sp.]
MDRIDEFTEFARARQHGLMRTAYLLCGNPSGAEDLVQEALTNLCRHWNRARKADSVDAYAHRTLINAYLTDRRKLGRERTTHIALAQAGELPIDEPGPQRRPDPAAQADLRLDLLSALEQLGRRSRAVLVLRYWEDLTVEGTAAALGCSAGTVKSQTARALARLRELLGEQIDAELDTGFGARGDRVAEAVDENGPEGARR